MMYCLHQKNNKWWIQTLWPCFVGKITQKCLQNGHYESKREEKLKCLSVFIYSSLLFHKRLGQASFSMLNKLISKELVLGLPNKRLCEDTVRGTCAKGKYLRSIFKRMVSHPNYLNSYTWTYSDPWECSIEEEKGMVSLLSRTTSDLLRPYFSSPKMKHMTCLSSSWNWSKKTKMWIN